MKLCCFSVNLCVFFFNKQAKALDSNPWLYHSLVHREHALVTSATVAVMLSAGIWGTLLDIMATILHEQ